MTHFDVRLKSHGDYDPTITIYADSFSVRSGAICNLIWFEKDGSYIACFPEPDILRISRLSYGCEDELCYSAS